MTEYGLFKDLLATIYTDEGKLFIHLFIFFIFILIIIFLTYIFPILKTA